jgi:NADH:ubiquinone reductase (H+-translocating)
MKDVAANAFTMKSIGDAMVLRNHVINMLEQADVEYEDMKLKKSLMTFVVGGGGFSGVETVGELNDFVRAISSKVRSVIYLIYMSRATAAHCSLEL